MSIKIDTHNKRVVPSYILEDMLSIHPAIDSDSGHILCHFSNIALLVAETSQGPVPLISTNDCILVTVGDIYINRLKVGIKSESKEVIIGPGGHIRVGSTTIYNKVAIEYLSYNKDMNMIFYEITVEGLGESILVELRKSDTKDHIAIIATTCKAERVEKREAIHV
ncbi:MAG: hypothetical protein QXO93_03840 [Acidilobaceae archaeon]